MFYLVHVFYPYPFSHYIFFPPLVLMQSFNEQSLYKRKLFSGYTGSYQCYEETEKNLFALTLPRKNKIKGLCLFLFVCLFLTGASFGQLSSSKPDILTKEYELHVPLTAKSFDNRYISIVFIFYFQISIYLSK